MTTITDLNLGTSANDGNGDTLRDGGEIINNNFDNLNSGKVETTDYTDADIKTKYENNADTNAFTDANEAKLAGITAGADMTKLVYDPQAIEADAFDMDNMVEGTDTKILTELERTKLAGIEAGAEVNNISDLNANALVDESENALHFHDTDRARANHTGTQSGDTVTIDNTGYEVLTGGDTQDLFTQTDFALLADRGTEVKSGTGLVTPQGTTFDVAATVGQVKDTTGYYPISYAGTTGVTPIAATSPGIYIYIDKTGALGQQTTEPTREEYREKLFLTRLVTNLGSVIAQEEAANPAGQYTNSLRDYLSYIKPLKKGLNITANADLTFQTSAGSIFKLGLGNATSPDSTNEVLFDSQAVTTFFEATRDTFTPTPLTSINVTTYDNNGVDTAMTNNRFKIMTVYKFTSGNLIVQNGQDEYGTLELAENAISSRSFVPNPRVSNGPRLGWIIVKKNTTDLSDTGDAKFIEDTGDSSTSTGTVGALLASNNLSDLDNTTTARTNLGLGNVDDTSDVDKPVSTATQDEIDTKEDAFTKSTAFNKDFGEVSGTILEGDKYTEIQDNSTKLAGIESGAEVNTIDSDPAGVTGADQVINVMSLTTAEYGAITPDANTFYLITDA